MTGSPPAEATNPESSALPVQIGRFMVLGQLGAGGMGLVYAAYDSELDRRVAIKLIRPQIAATGKSALAQTRLLREAQALARLSHPNIVTVHEVGVHDDQVFIAMEFLSGTTLKYWLRRMRRPWREVLDVFIQAGRGLEAAHNAGLVHRDFKPDNVMVTEDPATGRVERVRVFDFGVVQETRDSGVRTPNPDSNPLRSHSEAEPTSNVTSRPRLGRSLLSIDTPDSHDSLPPASGPESQITPGEEIYATGLTAAGALVGTPLYMAPEQYEQTADARSDQFSFCAALFEGVYRRRPFGGDTTARLHRAKRSGQIRRPPRNHNVPPWLHRLIVRGLAPDPNHRHPSLASLLAALEHGQQPRRPRLWLAATAGLVLVGTGIGVAVTRHSDTPLCSTAATDELAPVWNQDRRHAVAAAFRNSGRPFADVTYDTVTADIDAYATSWVAHRSHLCEAGTDPMHAPQQTAQLLCLDQRRDDLAALVDLFEVADGASVDHAVRAVAGLSAIAACNDINALLTRVDPPPIALIAGARALEQRLAEVRAREQVGKYAEGFTLVHEVLRDARSLGHPPLIAEALYWQGRLAHHLHGPAAAEANLHEATLLAIEVNHHELASRAASALVRVIGLELRRPAEGLLWSDITGVMLRRHPNTETEIHWHGDLGHLHVARGDLSAAAPEYSQALTQARTNLSADHPLVATALANMAGLQRLQGKFSAAEANYNRVLQIHQVALAPGHPLVAHAITDLARVAIDLGDHTRAAGLLDQARGICDAPERCPVDQRIEIFHLLGRNEQAAGRLVAARDFLEAALALTQASASPPRAELFTALGALELHQGNFDAAATNLDKSLDLLAKLYPEGHPNLVAPLVHRAAVALAQDQAWPAEQLLDQAMAIHRHDDLQRADMLELRSRIAHARDNLDAAISHQRRAHELYRSHFVNHHPKVVHAVLDLVRLLHSRGRAEDWLTTEVLLEATLSSQEQANTPALAQAPTCFKLAQVLAIQADHHDALARRRRARVLASTALSAFQQTSEYTDQVAEITTWLANLASD